MELIRKRFENSVIEKQTDAGTTRFRLTERKLDRAGDVVMPEGAVLDNFKTNPVVLFGHGWTSAQGRVPVGKVLPDSFNITKNHMDADIKFDDEGLDPFAKMIGNKVENGFLNAGSIGFRAIDISREAQFPKQRGITFTKWELFEFSIVAIPALATALAKREFKDLHDAIQKNFSEEDLALYDESINKYFSHTEQEIKSVVGDQFDLKTVAKDVNEMKGRILQLELELKNKSDNQEGIVVVDDTMLDDLGDLFTGIKQLSESLKTN